ncbi:MAG: DUF896 domain-containing protein [Eubacteriales bacterium]|jgi:uncharacterized protein YnzC (UPF0291/DUF896 family)
MDAAKIQRINELAALAKERALTPEEQQERELLRREYIDSMKSSLRHHLDHMTIVDQQGNRRKVRPKS